MKRRTEEKEKKTRARWTLLVSFAERVFGMYEGLLRVTRFAVFSKFSLLSLLALAVVPLAAFEAHIVNVTASIIQIDPPTVLPPGGQYSSFVDITIVDDDPDATHIFYTVTPGTDPSVALDPECGVYPGGPKPIGPFTIEDDAVIKAIACDGDQVTSHGSLITTEIYDLTLEGKIEGRKYHDLDKSGAVTNGDVALEGWRVNLVQGTTTIATTVTGAGGYYTFNGLIPGSYTVEEETRAGWEVITPSSANVTIDGAEAETVNFFNFDTGFACVPQPINFPANLAVQAAGSSTSTDNDDVGISNNVVINGDVRSNDEIEKDNSNGPRTINGNATAVNAIDPIITVSGSSTTGAASTSLPDAMIPFWRSKAQEGGTVNGSFVFPNNTVGLVMGPTEVMGNLTLGSSNELTVKGPLYIHGNVTIGSNSTINQDAAFGNQFATIIVDGTIDIDSNITFNGAGSTGTFLLVSTRAAVSGNGAAILTSQNNSDLGDVVLYASDGDVYIRSNRTLLAVFATHGTGSDSDDNAAIRLDSNVTVNYRALPTTISCGPRQPYETTSHVLINEFMPNPVGSDQGTAGAPLDGEWVEIFNPTASSVDLAGYVLYDSINTHALPIVSSNTNTGGTVVPSGGYIVVYRDGDTDFELNNSSPDSVRLFTASIGSGGVLVDSHVYTRSAPDDKSFARAPDGAANWIDPIATPGEPNNFFFEPLSGISADEPFDPPPLPSLVVPLPTEEIPVEEPMTFVAPAAPEPEDDSSAADSETDTTDRRTDGADTTDASSTDAAASSTEPAASDTVSEESNTTSTTSESALEDNSAVEGEAETTDVADRTDGSDGSDGSDTTDSADMTDATSTMTTSSDAIGTSSDSGAAGEPDQQTAP